MRERDGKTLRQISNYFYRVSGVYQRVCDYAASMYRYDWYAVPEIYDQKVKEEKVLTDFAKMLSFLDESHIKKLCNDIALSVIKDGAYYGYAVVEDDKFYLQDLPASYCRSRFNIGSDPAIEFDMRFFDDNFSDINYRLKVLKMFPKEFTKGYLWYKEQKLKQDEFSNVPSSWYLLDPNLSVKFSFGGNDIPLFVNAIPAILDLDAAQDLDRRKQM